MLHPGKHTGIKTFYFTTNASSLRAAQFGKNPKVRIYFFNGRVFKGVMLTGTAEILKDLKNKKTIWREGDAIVLFSGHN
jgi:general stress protein 26